MDQRPGFHPRSLFILVPVLKKVAHLFSRTNVSSQVQRCKSEVNKVGQVGQSHSVLWTCFVYGNRCRVSTERNECHDTSLAVWCRLLGNVADSCVRYV